MTWRRLTSSWSPWRTATCPCRGTAKSAGRGSTRGDSLFDSTIVGRTVHVVTERAGLPRLGAARTRTERELSAPTSARLLHGVMNVERKSETALRSAARGHDRAALGTGHDCQ